MGKSVPDANIVHRVGGKKIGIASRGKNAVNAFIVARVSEFSGDRISVAPEKDCLEVCQRISGCRQQSE